MPTKFRLRANELSTSIFRPHGFVESRIDGNILVQEATGPFNKEFVWAMASANAEARVQLVSIGPWGAILVFKHSALASLEMLREFGKYLATQVRKGQASVATALVMSPEVEGASIMSPHYLRVWAEAGIVCQHFDSISGAATWIRSLLRPALESQQQV